ncbi:MAG: hypothetical protein AB1942_15530 [Pseudomonadota bacterium]
MASPDPAPEPKPRRGPPFIVIGALLALLAGAAIAWILVSGDRGRAPPPPASEAGLVIDSSGAEDGPAAAGKLLRCFVQGQYVGELSLTDCARRNGVATDALDVGIDETGALAAADQGQMLIPLPPAEGADPAEDADPAEPQDETGAAPPSDVAASLCRRYEGGRWRRVGDMSLDDCVQALFAGRCEKPGQASYGRHGQQVLRLVTGRLEVSDDNRNFRPIAPQAPDCSLPPVQ